MTLYPLSPLTPLIPMALISSSMEHGPLSFPQPPPKDPPPAQQPPHPLMGAVAFLRGFLHDQGDLATSALQTITSSLDALSGSHGVLLQQSLASTELADRQGSRSLQAVGGYLAIAQGLASDGLALA